MKKTCAALLVCCMLAAVFTLPSFAVLHGDVDRDGSVLANDARLALRRSVALEDYLPGSAQFVAADMDGNGAVTASDARAVLRVSVGLQTDIPAMTPAEKTPDDAFVSAAQRFSLDLFRESTAEQKGNVMISPLSVLTALSMTANGTAGETLRQLEETLGGVKLPELNAYLRALCGSLPNAPPRYIRTSELDGSS